MSESVEPLPGRLLVGLFYALLHSGKLTVPQLNEAIDNAFAHDSCLFDSALEQYSTTMVKQIAAKIAWLRSSQVYDLPCETDLGGVQ